MADAAFLQANFLGGEWSPYAQGRADEEAYRTGLNRCYNYIPLEVGAGTRRPGTLFISTTRKGVAGVLREFHFTENAPYNMEFTPDHLRLVAGRSLLLKEQRTVVAVSTDDPAVVTVDTTETWSTGDEVEFAFTPINGASPAGPSPMFNRQFEITVIDSTHFTIADPVTEAGFDGSTVDLSGWTATLAKVVDFTTPYLASQLQALRVVQDEDTALVLHNLWAPRALEATTAPVENAPAVFDFTVPTFLDGPYLDPPTDGSTMTPAGLSGAVALTASSAASINGGEGFVTTDLGRMVRLFSEPLAWSSGTSYAKGTNVKYNNAYFQAINVNAGIEPDTDNGTNWVITTTAAAWTWGLITTVTDATHATVTLAAGGLLDQYQQPLAGGALLYTNPIQTWQLGLYSDTTGYPSCGCFYEGRFFLAGSIPNRFDATMSNENFNMSPTLLDGTVADNCGMSEILKGEDRNTVFWMAGTSAGIAAGTQGGEWAIQASSLNEPLTPTSIQAHKVTRYGCANVEPRNTGLSHVFVQRYQKQVFEYLTDVFSGKFIGTNIARKAKHLTGDGVAEIAYQAELAPIVWGRTLTNKLIGCTYKRESPFSTQPASFMGWHQHTLGSGREVESIQAGPSPDGTLDALMLITNDPTTNVRYIEQMTSIFEETGVITDAWFIDAAVVPTASEVKTVMGVLSVVFYGLGYIAGKTVTAWIGGVDGGDYAVSAAGTVTVPIDGSANPLLTSSLLAALTTQNDFGIIGASILLSPAGRGFYSSTGTAIDYTMANNYNAHLGTNAALSCFDWDAGVCYLRATTTTAQHVEAMNVATQAQVWDVDLTGDEYGSSNGATLGPDGHIYYGTSTSSALVNRFNTSTKATDQTYNDLQSLQGRSAFISAFIGLDGGVYTASVSVDSGNTGGSESSSIDIVAMGASPTYVTSVQPGETVSGGIAPSNVTLTRRGPSGAIFAFAMASTGASLGFYRLVVENATLAGMGNIRVLTPTDIHSGWTSFTLTEPIYDETDGNVLYFTTGSDSTSRLIKLNAMNGEIMWNLTVSGFYDMHTSRVRGGKLTVLGAEAFGVVDVYEVDTLAGTAVHSTETTIGNSGGANNSTDDGFGQIIVKVNDETDIQWETWGPAAGGGPAVITPAGYYIAPQVIGFNYTSQLQGLRAIDPASAGAQNGPALGKTRRVHMHATLLANSQGVQFGTDFTKPMRAARLLSSGRTQTLANNVLFSGVIQDTLEDTYSFDSMWATQTTRPYPTTIVSYECFLHTQDR